MPAVMLITRRTSKREMQLLVKYFENLQEVFPMHFEYYKTELLYLQSGTSSENTRRVPDNRLHKVNLTLHNGSKSAIRWFPLFVTESQIIILILRVELKRETRRTQNVRHNVTFS